MSDETITQIDYALRGAASCCFRGKYESSSGVTSFPHILIKQQSITLVDSGREISAGSYIASIDETYYTYTVQGGDDIDDIGNGIAAAVAE